MTDQTARRENAGHHGHAINSLRRALLLSV